jgi:hypothetical protein
VAAIVAGVWTSSGAAGGAEPSVEELKEQLTKLQARIEQLETRQRQPAAAADGAAVDATVRQVLNDAYSRSQLLDAEGFTAGYSDGKFLIQSADGNFVFSPNIFLQFRGVADWRQGSKNGVAQSDDVQNGFELRRLKFAFEGNAFSRDLTYRFQWATNRKSGVPELDEAWVRYHFDGTPFSVRGGQLPSPWDHESLTSSKRLLAADRSLLHELISAGGVGGDIYDQGVALEYDPGGPLRGAITLIDGFNSRNTNFQDGGGGAPALGLGSINWGVAGRVEYKLEGNWKQYEDFTALGNKTDLLVIGAGAEFDQGDNVDALFHTIDVQWEPQAVKGLSLYAAYVGLARHFRTVSTGVESNPYDWGFIAQAGYLLNNHWEIFARYDYTNLDPNAPAGSGTLGAAARVEDKIHEFTLGANYYLHGHAAKFTIDGTWLPNGSPVNADGAGILAQPNTKDQFLLRAQFQLLL